MHHGLNSCVFRQQWSMSRFKRGRSPTGSMLSSRRYVETSCFQVSSASRGGRSWTFAARVVEKLVLRITLMPPLEVYLLREDQLGIPPHHTSHAAVRCTVEIILMTVGVHYQMDWRVWGGDAERDWLETICRFVCIDVMFWHEASCRLADSWWILRGAGSPWLLLDRVSELPWV